MSSDHELEEPTVQKLTIPADVAEKIGAMNFPAELCDEAGTAKGVVVPVELFRELMRTWEDQAFPEEQLARARSETGGYTTAEAIAYVNRLIAERAGQ